jgi:hypothetical protein
MTQAKTGYQNRIELMQGTLDMRRGREFDTHDNASAKPVAAINESMAHRYWPQGDAIGKSVMVDQRLRRIVGVVSDYAYYDPANTDAQPVLFLPLAQDYNSDVIVPLRSRTTASDHGVPFRPLTSSPRRFGRTHAGASY